MRRVTAPRLTRFRGGSGDAKSRAPATFRVSRSAPYHPFTPTLHPLMQINGLRRATRRASPAASAASTTALTSL